jgi:hypothetical protein
VLRAITDTEGARGAGRDDENWLSPAQRADGAPARGRPAQHVRRARRDEVVFTTEALNEFLADQPRARGGTQ